MPQPPLDLALDLALAAALVMLGIVSVFSPDRLREGMERLCARPAALDGMPETSVRTLGAAAVLIGLSFLWSAARF